MENLGLESSPRKDEKPRKGSLIRKLSLGRSTLGWPTWSMIGRTQGRPSTRFTIRIEPGVLEYSKYGPSTAADAFNEAANHILKLRSITERDVQSVDITDNELVHQMCIVVFGSNMIEGVGSDRAETIHLCQKIFLGEGLSDIPERSFEYHQRLEQYIRANTQDNTKFRERKEVINHAMAFMYMVGAIIREDKPFSEDLIKNTHAILCSGIPVEAGNNEIVQSHKYAGKYRTQHVRAGNTNFVTPNRIDGAMKRFVEELNDHLIRAQQNQEIDPFFIAAQGCGEFVNIHPFLDGNGRTCRIILNTVLLKYAGTVCPIGEHDTERKEYIEIAKRRSEQESGNGELAGYALKQSLPTFRRLRDKIISKK